MFNRLRIAATIALWSALVFGVCFGTAWLLSSNSLAVWSSDETFAWALPLSIASGVIIALIASRKKAIRHD